MIGNSEFTEINNVGIINLQSLDQRKEWGGKEVLKVDPKLFAVDKWKEMLFGAQEDHRERSLVVSINEKDGQLITSKIFVDTKHASGPGLWPHGWKSAFGSLQDLVHVHTHFIEPEADHVKTSSMSDEDINSFVDFSVYQSTKATVMIDRGGVHMLVRMPNRFIERKTGKKIEIVDEAIKKAKAGGNTSMDIVRETAQRLSPFGIKYYYSESLAPGADGFITLKDAVKL